MQKPYKRKEMMQNGGNVASVAAFGLKKSARLHQDRTTCDGQKTRQTRAGLEWAKQCWQRSFVRLAGRPNHSCSTHFYPAGRATRRPGFEDRFLGPDSGPDSGTACPVPHSGVRGMRSQIPGCFSGPKSGTQNQAIPCGVRQRLSYTISRSKSSSSIPTPISLHTQRRRCLDRRLHQTIMKGKCAPMMKHPNNISNNPNENNRRKNRKQQRETPTNRKQTTNRRPQTRERIKNEYEQLTPTMLTRIRRTRPSTKNHKCATYKE